MKLIIEIPNDQILDAIQVSAIIKHVAGIVLSQGLLFAQERRVDSFSNVDATWKIEGMK